MQSESNWGKSPGGFDARSYRSVVGCQKMAEFRDPRSVYDRMLHLRARTFAPFTRKCSNALFNRNCPGTPRWCPGTPSERRSVGEFALEKLAFRSLARPQAAFCGTTWAVTINQTHINLDPPGTSEHFGCYTRCLRS